MVSTTSYVMKISRNGQVSIPAQARSRWQTDQVVVVDLGDYVLMRPVEDNDPARLRGKYVDQGPKSDDIRRSARRDSARRERR